MAGKERKLEEHIREVTGIEGSSPSALATFYSLQTIAKENYFSNISFFLLYFDVKVLFYHLGRITLEKCKKYKLKKEEADELAELDVSKIIGTPGMP